MRIFRQSLIHKSSLLAALFVTGSGVSYLILRQLAIPLPTFTSGQLLFALYAVFGGLLWFFVAHVVTPVRTIARQIQTLKTGRAYQHIDMQNRIDELGLIANFFNEAISAIERVSMDIRERERMSTELEFTKKVQQQLLPKKAPRIPGLDIIVRTRPASELGGDNFDIITKGENTFFYVGDATGHGFPAGLIMSMVNVLVHAAANMFDNTRDILVAVNKALQPKLLTTMFMTLVMLRWDHETRRLFFTGCGHEHILIYHAATGTCETIKSGGIALGMIPDNSKILRETELVVSPHDVVVLFTDGITEARSATGEMFGLERLSQLVQTNGAKHRADFIFSAISHAFAEFVGPDHMQADDITLAVVKCISEEASHLMLSIDTAGIKHDRPNWAWEKEI